MNTFNLGAMSLQKKAIITVFIIIELAVLFFAENYTVSAVKERTMLLEPYKKILGEDSVFVYDGQYPTKAMESDTPPTFIESQNSLLEGLEGNYKVYNFLIYNNPNYSDYTVYSVDDEIYKSLALPLVSGNYGNGENSAVASAGVGKGTIAIETPNGTMNLDICGTLTSSTFVPQSNVYGSDITVNDLYTAGKGGKVIITSRSGLGEAEKSFSCSWGFIVKFDSPKDAQEGIKHFKGIANTLSGSIIINNTNKLIADDLGSFIPVISCVLLIVLIGVISISSMIFDENKYRSGVLWLCGYSRKKIVLIQAASIAILLIAAMAVFALLAVVMNTLVSSGILNSDSFTKIGFGWGNFLVTLLTCAVLIGAATAMPAVKTFKKSPVEYLGRAK